MLDAVRRNIICRGYTAGAAGTVAVALLLSPLGAAVKQAAFPCWGLQPVPVPPVQLLALQVWWGSLEMGATTQTGADRCRVASPAGSCREQQDGGADLALSGRAPSAHGQAGRAVGFWRLTFSLLHLTWALQVLRGDERTSCLVETMVLLSWLIPAASSDAGGRAQPQPVLLSKLERGRLSCFVPLPSARGRPGKGSPEADGSRQGGWPPPLSPCAALVFADALAPSFRGWFSGLEVPSVLLNAG